MTNSINKLNKKKLNYKNEPNKLNKTNFILNNGTAKSYSILFLIMKC